MAKTFDDVLKQIFKKYKKKRHPEDIVDTINKSEKRLKRRYTKLPQTDPLEYTIDLIVSTKRALVDQILASSCMLYDDSNMPDRVYEYKGGLADDENVKKKAKNKYLDLIDILGAHELVGNFKLTDKGKPISDDLSNLVIWGSNRHTSKRTGGVKGIVIHYTAGGSSAPGVAKSAAEHYCKDNKKVSSDFTVDDGTIVQYNLDIDNRCCWAAGGNYGGPTEEGKGYDNHNCINIEVCSSFYNDIQLDGKSLGPDPEANMNVPNNKGWYFTTAVLKNTRALVKAIIKRYASDNNPIKIIRHFDTSGKQCPGIYGFNPDTFHSSPKIGRKDVTHITQNNEETWNKLKTNFFLGTDANISNYIDNKGIRETGKSPWVETPKPKKDENK